MAALQQQPWPECFTDRLLFLITQHDSPDREELCRSICGTPDPIVKPSSLRRILHGYGQHFDTLGTFNQFNWYKFPALEPEPEPEEEDEIDALFRIPEEEEEEEEPPTKRPRYDNNASVRNWVFSWQTMGNGPPHAPKKKMPFEQVVEERPEMQWVLHYARFVANFRKT